MGFRGRGGGGSEKGALKGFQEGAFQKAVRRQKHAFPRVRPPCVCLLYLFSGWLRAAALVVRVRGVSLEECSGISKAVMWEPGVCTLDSRGFRHFSAVHLWGC